MMDAANATIVLLGKSTERHSQMVMSSHKRDAYARPGVAEESRPFSGDTPDVPGKLDPCHASVRNATRHPARK